jgi:hypothetical protein
MCTNGNAADAADSVMVRRRVMRMNGHSLRGPHPVRPLVMSKRRQYRRSRCGRRLPQRSSADSAHIRYAKAPRFQRDLFSAGAECHDRSLGVQFGDMAVRAIPKRTGFGVRSEATRQSPSSCTGPTGWDCFVAALLTRNRGFAPVVMAGLGPAIHVFLSSSTTDVDGRPPAFAGACFAGHDYGGKGRGFIQGGSANGRCGTRNDT